MGKNNIIEINGIKYDARTGKNLSLDKTPAYPIKLSTQHKTPPKRPTMSDVVRRKPAKNSGRTQKPSSTLMRHSVKKPSVAARKHSRATAQLDAVATVPTPGIMIKKSVGSLSHKRLAKARHIPQSRLIKHFGSITSDSSNRYEPSPAAAAVPQTPVSVSRPPAHYKKPAKPQTTAELLEKAISKSTSHEEKYPVRRKNRRGLHIAGGIAVLLLLVGVTASQQLPNLRMHMASSKAGINAGMPAYKPAGYSVGEVAASSGTVSATFKSNSDQRQYTVVQKASNWDSQQLKDNFVTSHDKNYRTVSDAGRTLYIYGDHNATWVNAGIWYVIQSNGSLTTQQLTDLASSL